MTGFKSTIDKPMTGYLPGGTTNCGVTYQVPIYGYNAATQQYTSKVCGDNLTTGSGYWIYFPAVTTISGGVD